MSNNFFKTAIDNKHIKKIDSMFDSAERTLTRYTKYPIFGILPALSKSLLGAVQFSLATVSLLASLPLIMFKPFRSIALNSMRHMIHGITNMISGLILAVVPYANSLFKYNRAKKAEESFANVQEDEEIATSSDYLKILPYKSIVNTKWIIAGENKLQSVLFDEHELKSPYSGI